jgi:MATE family multidrug resistance protein
MASDGERSELSALSRLAAPLFAMQFGSMLLGVVDIMVVGRLGEAPVAAVGLGQTLVFATSVLGFGWMLALDPLIAQAIGAGEQERARNYLAQGLWVAGLGAIPLTLVVFSLSQSLELLGIEPDAAAHARPYLYARLPGILPFLWLAASRAFLSAHERTRPLVIGVIAANVVNLVLAYGLVFGVELLSIPAMGTTGAGIAATAGTLVQVAIVLGAVRALAPAGARWRPFGPMDGALMWRTMRLGTPIGLTLLAEVGSFTFVTMLMGNIGTRALAGHNVAITLISATFQMALAIGAAGAVRVGRAIGRGETRAARLAGLTAIGLVSAFMLACALAFLAVPAQLASIITDEPRVVAAAVPLLLVAAAFQLFDGVQAVAAGALRGAGDTRWPLALNLVGHYAIGIPIGAWLAFERGLGAVGLWWGLSAGLTAVAIALTVRFTRLTSGEVARV